MDDKFAAIPEDLAERGLRYTKDQFGEVLQQTEVYVRENPTQSVLYALAAGYILNRLPLGRVLGGVLRLLILVFKPALLIYGASKLYRVAQQNEA
ncbi:MAG TPA: hypothetical protein VGQ82_01945 [Chthoniobacterales bacterium]|nr:hypothetical protein [Chthoniobacterales bacterium]